MLTASVSSPWVFEWTFEDPLVAAELTAAGAALHSWCCECLREWWQKSHQRWRLGENWFASSAFHHLLQERERERERESERECNVSLQTTREGIKNNKHWWVMHINHQRMASFFTVSFHEAHKYMHTQHKHNNVDTHTHTHLRQSVHQRSSVA